jgi:cell division protease FtsH
MSDKIGPMTVGHEDRQVFLGKDFVHQESLSEATAQLVDAEIRSIVYEAHEAALKILNEHRNLLDKMSEVLLDKETLNIDEIFEIILSEINEGEREFIEQKYKKASEMKIDNSLNKNIDEQEINEESTGETDKEE